MKTAVISQEKKFLEEVKRLLKGRDETLDLSVFQGNGTQVGPATDQTHPDLLILDGLYENQQQLAELGMVISHHPNMAIIMLSQNQSPDFLIQAMRAGVREVLPAPAETGTLLEAVTRIQQRMTSASTPRKKGKVIAFIPCKGGSGATFLAANLGYALAALENKKVALIDLNLQFGDAFLFVSDRPAQFTLSDVVRQITRLDASFLASSMIQVLPNFAVLAAPEEPENSVAIKPEYIETLLNMAVSHYDYVILDIGRGLDAVSIKALDHANVIFPVLQMTLPFVRDAKRLLSVFHSLGYPDDRITMIANRYEKGGEIDLKDVEKTLGLKVSYTVPNSFAAVATSINQGIPIVKLSARDAVAKSLALLAHNLVHGSMQNQGWLKNLLHMT